MVNIPEQLQGAWLFPCSPMGRNPLVKWKSESSNDPAKWAEWGQRFPGCNWGINCARSGFFVIDVDPKGLEWWEANGPKDTFLVRTPRGGLHAYYKGEGPSTVSRIAPGIDTRGGILQDGGEYLSSGFVVAPGSKREAGTYEVIGGEIAPLADTILDLIPERNKPTVQGLPDNPDMDLPVNVKRVEEMLRGYVEAGRVAIEGKGGDDLTFKVACAVLEKAVSPAKAFDMLANIWNPHCIPPWEDWELEAKIVSALNSGDDTRTGAKGIVASEKVFANFVAEYEGPTEEPKKRGRFTPMRLADARKDVRPARWLIPGILPAEGAGVLYGRYGTGKTFLALDWSLCLACGIPGQWGAPPVKHTVLFLAGESSYALRKERVDSWCEKYGQEPEEANFILVPGVPSFRDAEGWQEIRDGLREMGVTPDLIVIDTLSRQMEGLKENDNDDGKTVQTFNESLAEHYDCFVLALGHTGKNQSNGLRGGSAVPSNSDAMFFLKFVNDYESLFHIEKLKESDPGNPIGLKKVKVGNSIVLDKSDAVGEGKPTKSTRYPWASAAEVAKILEELGGETGELILFKEISGKYGIDTRIVKAQLKSNSELDHLRGENGRWSLPKEWDL